MKGLIFSIKRYSVHDGPGIRVTVFMKGCPLSCRWCHNPEGIFPCQETVVSKYRVGGKEFSKTEEVGTWYTVGELLAILDRERVFMNQSGGGVTFSGGEPMLQSEFLLAVLRECRNAGFHTTVDTSGYSLTSNYKAIVPFTDLFLFDIKHLDAQKHLEATGVTNSGILENFSFLLNNAREVALRFPVIPGFNDDSDHVGRVISLVGREKTESLKRINLLPFHKIGSSKYRKFNLPWLMDGVEPPSKEEMHELKNLFQSTGIKVKIGG
jgi:pyruvate formate lyase activating enzyme